jgi:hypothetical protein
MMKKILTILVLILITSAAEAQCDALYKYAYKGRIKRVNISDTIQVNILVPSDLTFYGNKKNRGKKFNPEKIELNNEQNEYFKEFYTHGPCKRNQEKYLKALFIDGIKQYKTVIQVQSNGDIEKLIDIKDIKFKINGNYIEIELPELII